MQKTKITDIVTSRTVWAGVIMAIVALFNIFTHDIIPHSAEVKAASALVVLACLLGIILFRARARNLLRFGSDDKSIMALVLAPLILSGLFTQGCMSIGSMKDTWDKMTPAEQTLVVADSLQKGHLRLKEIYLEVYNSVDEKTKDKMMTSLAPKINRAQTLIELFVTAAIAWNETKVKPENIDVLKADAQTAYGGVSTELQSISVTSGGSAK